jgi:hypothetical protein
MIPTNIPADEDQIIIGAVYPATRDFLLDMHRIFINNETNYESSKDVFLWMRLLFRVSNQ